MARPWATSQFKHIPKRFTDLTIGKVCLISVKPEDGGPLLRIPAQRVALGSGASRPARSAKSCSITSTRTSVEMTPRLPRAASKFASTLPGRKVQPGVYRVALGHRACSSFQMTCPVALAASLHHEYPQVSLVFPGYRGSRDDRRLGATACAALHKFYTPALA